MSPESYEAATIAACSLPACPPARLPEGREAIAGHATHYGPSYNGQPMGCPGAGFYSSADPTIAAVGPARYAQWPCGTQLRLCGPAGCATVTRRDACPGCAPNVVDLSEAANSLVCGAPPHTCDITIEVLP